MSVHYLSPRHRLRAVQFRPLSWPAEWPRTTAPRRRHAVVQVSALGYAPNRTLSPTEAMAQLFRVLEAMWATTCVVCANVTTQAAHPATAQDPGAVALFELDGEQHVLACDLWDRPADNIAGITAMLDSIRREASGRFGARVQAMARQAMGAPAPALPAAWHEVLGVAPEAPLRDVEMAYRSRARQIHPDVGGSAPDMVRLNGAIAEARRVATV